MLSLVLVALTITAGPPSPQQRGTPDPEIRLTVDRMFTAMRTRDTAALRTVFDTGARLMTTFTDRNGKPTLRVSPIERFIQAIGGATSVPDERIYDVEVRQDANLATVWTRYTFYAGERVSHCGYDAFQLFKSEQGWRIIAIADTQQREGCVP